MFLRQQGWRGSLVFVMVLGVLSASLVEAEIIRRVNPDGSVTVYVPSGGPSLPRVGPCGVSLDEPTSFEEAHAAYGQALERLRAAPASRECREVVVRLGRLRAELGRRAGQATVYDELAIANDLNAATGGTR